MALTCCWPMAAFAVVDCKLGGAAVDPANGNTTQGKSGMMRCVDRDSGVLVREQELRNGKFVGLERYYEGGKLVKEFSVNERGNKQGRAREFAPSGQLLRDETFDNGDRVGIGRQFRANGRLSRIAFVAAREGELAVAEFTAEGRLADLRCDREPRLAPDVDDARLFGFGGASQVELYGNAATPRARLTLEKGVRVRQEFLYDNGKPQRIVLLQGDKRVEQRFSAAGVKLFEGQSVVVGTRTQVELEQRFADSGTLTNELRWKGGAPVSESDYYLSGQLRRQVVYSGEPEARERRIRRYYDTGKLAGEGRYVKEARGGERAVGVQKTFFEDGGLQSETTYDDRGRPSRERSWDRGGRLLRDDEVFEDRSRKAYSK